MKSFKTFRFSLLLVLIFTSSIAFSQENSFHFGVSLNPQITHQITDKPDYEHSEDNFSHSATGNIYYYIGSNFQLVSGLSLSHYKMNKIDSESYSKCSFSNDGELHDTYYRHDYQIYYLGVPLEARWNIVGKKKHLFLQFGLEGLLKLDTDPSDTFVVCGEKIEDTLPRDPYFRTIKSFLLLSKIGVGFEFPLHKKVMLFFEPNIQYSLTELFKYEVYKSRFLSVGLNTGIKF